MEQSTNILTGCRTVLAYILLLWCFAFTSHAKPVVTIGLVHDGQWQRFQDFTELIKDETRQLLAEDFEVRFPSGKEIDGRWNFKGIQSGIEQLLSDPEVDIIIAQGVVASHKITHVPNLNKPVIAAHILDIELQGLPFDKGKSGINNLAYLTSDSDFEQALQSFYEVAPFKHLGVLINPLVIDAIPTVKQVVEAISAEFPFSIELIPVDPPVKGIVAGLPKHIDAVMLAPLMKLNETELKILADGLIANELPSFSVWGRPEVEQGILMSTAPSADVYRFARRIALNIQRILLGENASELGVMFQEGTQLTINMQTARQIRVWPTWSVLTEAELINENTGIIGKPLTLSQVLELAQKQNINVELAYQDAFVGRQELSQRVSDLLPNVEASYSVRKIDRDRAKASFGILPEYLSTAAVSLTQPVYADGLWANYRAEQAFQAAREYAIHQTSLDIALSATQAYLNLLKAQTLERIRKGNLRLTRSNLELARMRESIGVANVSEVYRWESEIADKKLEVIESQSISEQAEIQLNRLLRWPQTTKIKTEETTLQNPDLLISDPRLNQYLNNPWALAILREFMVIEGFNASPELKAIEQQIIAQKRVLVSAKRAHYIPDLAFKADVDKTVSRDGEGTNQAFDFQQFGGGFNQLDFDADNINWTLSLQASLPLFTSGKQTAEVKKAYESLKRLQLQYDAKRAEIEERVRLALHQGDVSFSNIGLSQQSAEAAKKNLDYVTDAYSRGLMSIIELIDAQNASFGASENAASAIYDFLSDLMAIQRAIGQFDFSLNAESRKAWFSRLEKFFQENGGFLNRTYRVSQ